MKTATLQRRPSTDKGTFGDWESYTGFKCVTAERPNKVHHPCIPAGTYTCKIRYSNLHKAQDYGFGEGMVYGIQNVPGRSDIEIHSANWAVPIKTAKEDEHLQLLGCIAPGANITGVLVPEPDGRVLLGVTSSFFATKALMADMKGEEFQLTIKEAV